VPVLAQGCGIPPEHLEQVFKYGFTTVDAGAAAASVSASAPWKLKKFRFDC
jgi:sensor histidine kinase regulating citrate/malate metabolism